jgi:hypothetical protein
MRRHRYVLGALLGVGLEGAVAWAGTVNVPSGNVSALKSAMSNAKPGDVIVLNGVYNMGGSGLTTSVDGTAGQRITVKAGPGGATLSGTVGSGSGIGCNNDYYTFQGLTIVGFQKSVRIDGASHGILDGLVCKNSGNESIKLKNSSQYWLVENCSVSDAGMEGYYVGDADQNWEGGGVDRSGYVTFLNDTAFRTGNDGFDCKEGTQNVKIINCSVDWDGTVPGGNNEGNSGVYDRCTNMQVINLIAKNNGSAGDVVRANRMTAVDGKTYGSGTEIYGVSGVDMSGWFLYTNHLDTRLYTNYSMSGLDGGLLESGSRTPAMVSPGSFVEMTWVGEGGAAYLPEPGGVAVVGVGAGVLMGCRRRAPGRGKAAGLL